MLASVTACSSPGSDDAGQRPGDLGRAVAHRGAADGTSGRRAGARADRGTGQAGRRGPGAGGEAERRGRPVPPRDGPVLGADISWPQCPPGMGIEHKETSGQPMPTAGGGVRRHRADQRPRLPRQPVPGRPGRLGPRAPACWCAAYSVISWPDEAAQRAVRRARVRPATRRRSSTSASMEAAGLDSPIVWLDVEQVPHYEWCGQHRGQRRGGARRRAGLPRRRLPDRRLLHAVHLELARRRPEPRGARVAGGRADLAGRGRGPLRPRTGRSRAARPCSASGSRTPGTRTSPVPAPSGDWGSSSRAGAGPRRRYPERWSRRTPEATTS